MNRRVKTYRQHIIISSIHLFIGKVLLICHKSISSSSSRVNCLGGQITTCPMAIMVALITQPPQFCHLRCYQILGCTMRNQNSRFTSIVWVKYESPSSSSIWSTKSTWICPIIMILISPIVTCAPQETKSNHLSHSTILSPLSQMYHQTEKSMPGCEVGFRGKTVSSREIVGLWAWLWHIDGGGCMLGSRFPS